METSAFVLNDSIMVTNLLNQIFGSKNDREIKTIRPIVEQINGLESGLTPLSDHALADKTQEFKKRLGPERLWTTSCRRPTRSAVKCPAAS